MDVSLNLFIIQPNSASTGAQNAPFHTAITQLHLIFLLWYVSNLSIFQDSEACPGQSGSVSDYIFWFRA
jgi:hypothetical protein